MRTYRQPKVVCFVREGVPPQPPFKLHYERKFLNMAIYHCSIKNIGRSSGKSAIAASAYRSGEKLEDLETGVHHDYTKKRGIEYTEIILCKNAPREYQDRATLWNEVHKIEKVNDARLAREWELAIPKELSLEQGQKLVHDFGKSLADEGMCVDIAIHDKGDGNRHAHIMGTTRQIKENGEWGAKEKKAYALDDKGERIPVIDPNTGEQKVDSRNRKQWHRVTVEANDWNKREKVEEWRERWAEYCNHYLKKENQIDHRSYKRQGIEQMPTIHEGYVARQIEQRGGNSEVCQLNRDIKEYNNLTIKQNIIVRVIDRLSKTVAKVEKEIKGLYERFTRFKSRRIDERVRADGEQSSRERLASLISSGASREVEKASTIPGTTGTTATVANIGDFLGQLNAEERASEEKRDNSAIERKGRDIQQERLNQERERSVKAEREVGMGKSRGRDKER